MLGGNLGSLLYGNVSVMYRLVSTSDMLKETMDPHEVAPFHFNPETNTSFAVFQPRFLSTSTISKGYNVGWFLVVNSFDMFLF